MENVLFLRTQDVIEKTADRYRVKRTALAAESAYSEKESGLLIGHSKALVEGFCKYILNEYKVEYPDDIKVGKLAKKAVDVFQVGKGLNNEKKTIIKREI